MLTTYEAIMAEVEYRRERLSNYGPIERPHWRPRRRRRGNSSAGQVTSPPVAAPQSLPEPEPVDAREPVTVDSRPGRA